VNGAIKTSPMDFPTTCTTGYRFTFNGMEKDDEIKGIGNSLDFGARIYDSRLGRWMSVDPLAAKYPSWSPYSAFRNNPILYVDPDGKEWVNAFDAVVAQKEKAFLDNPNSNKLQRQLNIAKENQMKVNEVINNLKENDVALYNYIENLTIKDAVTGEKVNVKVTVGLDYRSGRVGTEDAHTNYRLMSSSGEKHFVEYEGLERKYKITPGPINSNDEIGFDVTLFSTPDWADINLSNEAGDIMFRMEYPDAAAKSGTDKGKSYDDYVKKGTAGYYSFEVEETYKNRKKSGEGKDPNNNPYPLKNE